MTEYNDKSKVVAVNNFHDIHSSVNMAIKLESFIRSIINTDPSHTTFKKGFIFDTITVDINRVTVTLTTTRRLGFLLLALDANTSLTHGDVKSVDKWLTIILDQWVSRVYEARKPKKKNVAKIIDRIKELTK